MIIEINVMCTCRGPDLAARLDTAIDVAAHAVTYLHIACIQIQIWKYFDMNNLSSLR